MLGPPLLRVSTLQLVYAAVAVRLPDERSAALDLAGRVHMPWIRRAELEALPAEARAAALARLRAQIDDRLASRADWLDFWRESEVIVAELRAAEHDLWSHDYDGDARHLWGWDYMRPQQARRLQIQFNFGAPCQTFWRGEDGRFATDRRDD